MNQSTSSLAQRLVRDVGVFKFDAEGDQVIGVVVGEMTWQEGDYGTFPVVTVETARGGWAEFGYDDAADVEERRGRAG